MGAGQTVTNADAWLGGVIIAVTGVILYFVPLITGALRRVRNLGALAVVNIFAGWTVIGWVVALAMACRSREPVSRSAGS
jgi:hypothetical protein